MVTNILNVSEYRQLSSLLLAAAREFVYQKEYSIGVFTTRATIWLRVILVTSESLVEISI